MPCRTSRPTSCACTSAGATTRGRTTTTCPWRTSSRLSLRPGPTASLSKPPTRATPTSGSYSSASSCQRARRSFPECSTRPPTSSSTRSSSPRGSPATRGWSAARTSSPGRTAGSGPGSAKPPWIPTSSGPSWRAWPKALGWLRASSGRSPLVEIEHLADRGVGHTNLDARALLLQEHRDPRVTLAPAPVERLGHLFERDVREPHGHLVLAAEARRQRDVLVRQSQRERRRLEPPRQELIDEALERATPTDRALAHRLPQRERIDARPDTEREDLGQRCLDDVAGTVVDQLRDRGPTARTA